jgi:hypothetical protein
MGIVGHARTGVSPLVVVDSVTAHQSTSSQPCLADISLIEQASCYHPDMLTLLDYDPAVPCVVAGGGGAYSSKNSSKNSTSITSKGKGKHSVRRTTAAAAATATAATAALGSSYTTSGISSSSGSSGSVYYAMDTAAARQQLLAQLQQRLQLQQLEHQQHKGLWGGLLLQ